MDFGGLPMAQLEMLRRQGGLDVFEITRKGAKELIAAEKRGGPLPDHLDFGVQEQCICCMSNIHSPRKAMRCGQCKAIILCSKECMKYYWNRGARGISSPLQLTHKQLCADNKRHMERLPETQDIARMFPWCRLEKDGTFNYDIACARFDVLGGAGYGYWSQRGGRAPHADLGPLGKEMADLTLGGLLKVEDFIDGNDLLKKTHLSDEQGWKLPSRFIPYLEFSDPSAKKPVVVTDLGESIRDWRSWYEWRRLPLESPAALLMAVPLSVYQMLVHCLGLTNPSAGSADKRVALEVHLVGAEVELNYIPLFSELALLLPYHDINLVFFGGAVKSLVEAASRKSGALATQSLVYSYVAPDELGSGAVTVQFSGKAKAWEPHTEHGMPDAIVACNAGLGSYPDWIPVVRLAHYYDVPFAVTEYAEQSAEHQRSLIPRWLEAVPGCTPRDDYPIALNPFQRPGQRGIPVVRMPNVSNGFTLTVVRK